MFLKFFFSGCRNRNNMFRGLCPFTKYLWSLNKQILPLARNVTPVPADSVNFIHEFKMRSCCKETKIIQLQILNLQHWMDKDGPRHSCHLSR